MPKRNMGRELPWSVPPELLLHPAPELAEGHAQHLVLDADLFQVVLKARIASLTPCSRSACMPWVWSLSTTCWAWVSKPVSLTQ